MCIVGACAVIESCSVPRLFVVDCCCAVFARVLLVLYRACVWRPCALCSSVSGLVPCFLVSCFLFLVFCLLFLVSRFLFLDTCRLFLFLVPSCSLFLVSCSLFLVSCFCFWLLVSCFCFLFFFFPEILSRLRRSRGKRKYKPQFKRYHWF